MTRRELICSCHVHSHDAHEAGCGEPEDGFRAVARPRRVTDRIVFEHVQQAARDTTTMQNLRLTI